MDNLGAENHLVIDRCWPESGRVDPADDAAYDAAVRRGNYMAELRERVMAVPVQVVATHELLMALLMARQAMQHCAKCYTNEIDALVLQLECARRTAGRK